MTLLACIQNTQICEIDFLTLYAYSITIWDFLIRTWTWFCAVQMYENVYSTFFKSIKIIRLWSRKIVDSSFLFIVAKMLFQFTNALFFWKKIVKQNLNLFCACIKIRPLSVKNEHKNDEIKNQF